jgi:hypothetical protein
VTLWCCTWTCCTTANVHRLNVTDQPEITLENFSRCGQCSMLKHRFGFPHARKVPTAELDSRRSSSSCELSSAVRVRGSAVHVLVWWRSVLTLPTFYPAFFVLYELLISLPIGRGGCLTGGVSCRKLRLVFSTGQLAQSIETDSGFGKRETLCTTLGASGPLPVVYSTKVKGPSIITAEG